MPIKTSAVEKPLVKLRKALGKFSKRPTPDEVHDLRTNLRKVEAILHALLLDDKRKGKRLLRATAPIRKRAGDVRDMDVLIAFASTVNDNREDECKVQLLEHLGDNRLQSARKLQQLVSKRKKTAGRSLKTFARFIERQAEGNKDQLNQKWAADAAAVSLQLASELAQWPKLTKDNIHPFRLKVKELRNVLKTSGENSRLIDELGNVKDTIGEWHDWVELSAIADDVLQDHKQCAVKSAIQAKVKEKFNGALTDADRVRSRFLASSNRDNKNRHPSRKVGQPSLEAAATLAA